MYEFPRASVTKDQKFDRKLFLHSSGNNKSEIKSCALSWLLGVTGHPWLAATGLQLRSVIPCLFPLCLSVFMQDALCLFSFYKVTSLTGLRSFPV